MPIQVHDGATRAVILADVFRQVRQPQRHRLPVAGYHRIGRHIGDRHVEVEPLALHRIRTLHAAPVEGLRQHVSIAVESHCGGLGFVELPDSVLRGRVLKVHIPQPEATIAGLDQLRAIVPQGRQPVGVERHLEAQLYIGAQRFLSGKPHRPCQQQACRENDRPNQGSHAVALMFIS